MSTEKKDVGSKDRCYTYNIKRKKSRRYTYRILGICLVILCMAPFIPFFMGYGGKHFVVMILDLAFMAYGFYIIKFSFGDGMYDQRFSFEEDKFSVEGKRKTKTYRYSEIVDLDHIVPENEDVYSLIHLVMQREKYLIPFTYKKAVCDTIYSFINERMLAAAAEMLNDATEEAK